MLVEGRSSKIAPSWVWAGAVICIPPPEVEPDMAEVHLCEVDDR